jgi:periplasmic divalent cation tolerance protein
VRAAHSYDVPEVIATPIIGGNLDYLAWLEAETSTSG